VDTPFSAPTPGLVAAGLFQYLQPLIEPINSEHVQCYPLGADHERDVHESMARTANDLERVFPEWATGLKTTPFFVNQQFLQKIASEPQPREVFVFYERHIFLGMGAIRPTLEDDAVQLLFWVDKNQQRRGVATFIARWLTEHALVHRKINRIQIQHPVEVIASGRIAMNLGFTLTEMLDCENGEPTDDPHWLVWEL
jgi:RimJ/RimL family protein N-acetyltransferase